MRTLVIGDVHSGLKALQQVLKRAHVDSGDQLIFLGDYVDGWSQAVETIDFLMALSLDPKMSPGDTYYPKRLKNYREIYIGHTPVTRIGKTVPHKAANVWNIDTGAAFKGTLSVVDVDTKEVWQSDPVHTFYPDERGRN